jgi:hypothetical protein
MVVSDRSRLKPIISRQLFTPALKKRFTRRTRLSKPGADWSAMPRDPHLPLSALIRLR